MDSNAHSSSFGDKTNKRGDKLDLFIAHHKLDIENQGLTPTFQARGAQTIIDITLTARLSVSVTNWTVSQEYNGSDHNTITFQVEQDRQKIEPTWKWHKAHFSSDIQRGRSSTHAFCTELKKQSKASFCPALAEGWP